MCDYQPIPAFISVEDKTVKVSAENARIVANQSAYDVMMIDDPWEMHMQL